MSRISTSPTVVSGRHSFCVICHLDCGSLSIVTRGMRTLVISDLHLGMRYERDVLRRRAPLAVLLEALGGVERLVLLGDVVELSERNSDDALAVAQPVLRALERRLGRDREVILVPGTMIGALSLRGSRRWGPGSRSTARCRSTPTPELAAVSSWQAPAQLSAAIRGCGSPKGCGPPRHYLNGTFCRRGRSASRAGDWAGYHRPIDYGPAGGLSLRTAHEAISGALREPLAEVADRLGVLGRAATWKRRPESCCALSWREPTPGS